MGFHNSNKHEAKKNHKCEWCSGTIVKQTDYIAHSGVFEDGFYSYKTHITCNDDLQEAFSLYSGDCFDYELTLEYCRERATDEDPQLVQEPSK